MEIDFTKLDSKPICGTHGCSNTATYICWTSLFNETDLIKHLQVMRPILVCNKCLNELLR